MEARGVDGVVEMTARTSVDVGWMAGMLLETMVRLRSAVSWPGVRRDDGVTGCDDGVAETPGVNVVGGALGLYAYGGGWSWRR